VKSNLILQLSTTVPSPLIFPRINQTECSITSSSCETFV